MSEAPQATRHVIIRGRVQGVGYRAWTEYTALDRGSPAGSAIATTVRSRRCLPDQPRRSPR